MSSEIESKSKMREEVMSFYMMAFVGKGSGDCFYLTEGNT
jgi:hypothetical protein